MKFVTTLAVFGFVTLVSFASAGGHLASLEGREVVFVIENTYPNLQFIERGTGNAIS